MRLSEFISENKPAIVKEWVEFAESLTDAPSTMTKLQLKDHIEQVLLFIILDINSAQTNRQQVNKSHGKGNENTDGKDTASKIHGSVRHADGFDMVQMVSEYRALRASIIKLWMAVKTSFAVDDLLDLTRFNESIDQSLAESVARFMEKVNYSKDLLLGTLGHDIRSPLGAMTMSAQLMPLVGSLNEKQTGLATQIERSGARVTSIVTDLLDLGRARLGSGLLLHRQKMTIRPLVEGIINEMHIQYPEGSIFLKTSGETEGEWDNTRLGQALSNLIANAIQYGAKNKPITVSVINGADNVLISVHNEGTSIPPAQLSTLFNSFTRGINISHSPNSTSSNLGLGLFITKEIAESHGGSIYVTSDESSGTTFSIKLPLKENA